MYKNGKWAKQIISMQDEEGKWGCFHSLSQFYGAPLTTEQALRRLQCLGYTIEDECIQRAVAYMEDCLIGKKFIPDRSEKVHDWKVFTDMILATWIRRFTEDNFYANQAAEKWAGIVRRVFVEVGYSQEHYEKVYKEILQPNGGRIIRLMNFYPISMITGLLDENTEKVFMDYVLNYDGGIYYIYDRRLSVLPERFESRETSRYLGAIELLAEYRCAKEKLGFVVEWLEQQKNENDRWDMGKEVNDKVYFPLSDDWRKVEKREKDCTLRIERLLKKIGG